MYRKFSRSCPKGGTCLVDVIIAEFAIGEGEITRASILEKLPSLRLTPRQASYRLDHMVKNGTLTKIGVGRNTRYTLNKNGRSVTYIMHLSNEPFESISSGRKTVEMRLNDKRRKYIDIGDFIIFNKDGGDTLLVKVVDKAVYNDFEELYAHYGDKTVLGYGENEPASPSDMLKYYTEEQIKAHGTVAFTVSVVKK